MTSSSSNLRKVLVTGATGFVGAAIARALLARDDVAVRVLCRPGNERLNLVGLDVELIEGDLRDPRSLEAAVTGCDAVFHAAADYRIWVPEPEAMFATNVQGTVALYEAADRAGVTRFVYTSSVATLGIPHPTSGAHPPTGSASARPAVGDEQTPVSLDDMIGVYKRSKFVAERRLEEASSGARLEVVYLHPTAPVGPGDVRPTPTGRLILDAATGRMPAYVDTGLNIVHVDDVAAGHLAAWERAPAGRHYVLGGDNLSLRQILTRVTALVGRPAPRWRLRASWLMPAAWVSELWGRVAQAEPRLVRDALRMSQKLMHFSSERAVRELGYQSRPAEAAFRDALEWFARHGYGDIALQPAE